MGLFDIFRLDRKKNTANVAKERLQILIAHEHASRAGAPDYFPKMRDEIMDVIRKYVAVEDKGVNVNLEKGDDYDVLELNITLPERH
ncbi:MAG TPA: cell division topological specificity factor MinE [Leucothrix mucor]|uniref:Cell division topological specificity factor n=1 Tax=Leucothrix mucor TaxID=45248 RepID=A0A7V2WVZ1_LEUMU|nr:cell division topological specificity factor MinE [Leucothrix mucor]